MLVEVSQRFGNPRRRFYAVLVLHSDGRLERYRRDGKVVPLATAVYWPKPPMAERVLQGFAPRAWGSQDDSACIIKNLPVWLLRRPHGIARRVIAWKAMYERTQLQNAFFSCIPMRNVGLPLDEPWAGRYPPVITVIPTTDVLVQALNTGTLLRRLTYGMERIYVSEFACIRAPSIQPALCALATRFPSRLVIVRAEHLGQIPKILRVTRPLAVEFQFRGSELTNRYKDDFGYDKFDAPQALKGIHRISVGKEPRGVRMLFGYEELIDFHTWEELDMSILEAMAEKRAAMHKQQEAHSIERLRGMIIKKKANTGSNNGKTGHII